ETRRRRTADGATLRGPSTRLSGIRGHHRPFLPHQFRPPLLLRRRQGGSPGARDHEYFGGRRLAHGQQLSTNVGKSPSARFRSSRLCAPPVLSGGSMITVSPLAITGYATCNALGATRASVVDALFTGRSG